MPAIFISHSSADRVVSDEVKAALARLGFERVFLDFDKATGIGVGDNWEKRLYEELSRCHAVLLLLTPAWLASKWCFVELAQARALGKVILPVLCAPLGGQFVLPEVQAVDLVDWNADGLTRLEQRLRAISNELARGFTLDPSRPPYPGIAAFEAEDAAIYFGRDEESRAVIERLDARRTQGGARFVIIIGASGSGKSSLLKASVLPQLGQRRAQWVLLPCIRPEKAPLEALAKAIAHHAGKPEAWREWHERLTGADAVAAIERLTQDARIGDARAATVLLPIDQFEEMFTTTGTTERAAFSALLAAVFDRDLAFMVIATGRSDVLEGLVESNELVHRYEPYPLAAMPLERVPRLVEGPAAVAGLNVEKGLSERIARDVESTDALPLLAHMLSLLYQRGADDKKLALAEYEALGDPARGLNPIQNSVRLAADQAIARVKPSEQELAALRDAFVPHLVRVRIDDGKRVRQPARRAELPQEALRLVGALVEARLLSTRGAEGGEALVEVTHESLFKAWPTLDRWLTEEQAFLSDLERIRGAYENWSQAPAEQKTGELLYALLLSRARDWLLKYPQRFAGRGMEPLRAFIAASAEVADAERARAQAAEARRRRIERVALVSALVAIVVLAVTGWLAWDAQVSAERAQARAETERDRADAQRQQAQITQSRFLTDLAAQHYRSGDHGTAVALAMEALPVARRNEPLRPYVAAAESMLYQAVAQLREQKVSPITIAPKAAIASRDGRRVIVATQDVALLYDATNGAELRRLSVDKPLHLAQFSRDGRRILSASPSGNAQIWDAEDGKLLHVLNHNNKTVVAGTFSHDGSHVATMTDEGDGQLWNAADGKPVRPLPDIRMVGPDAFSPDGRRLVTLTGDGEAQVWDLTDPTAAPRMLTGAGASGNQISAYLPDGRHVLLTSSDDKGGGVWDAESNGKINLPPSVGELRIASSTDTKVALVSSEGVLVWNVTAGAAKFPLNVLKQSAIRSAALSPDGELIAAGSEDGTVRIWSLRDGFELAMLRSHTGSVRAMAFSADGQRLVTVSEDQTIRIWNGTAGGAVLPLGGKTQRVYGATFSPDSREVVGAAVAEKDGAAFYRRVPGSIASRWDATSGAHLAAKDLNTPIDGIIFAPDEKQVIAKAHHLRSWDRTADALSVIPGDYGQILAVSAKRTRILLGGHSDQWHVWDIASGTAPVQIPKQERVFTADFSPSEQYLVTASGDDAQILEVETGKVIEKFGRSRKIVSAAYSPNGTMIATGSDDGTIRLWDAETRTEQATWTLADTDRVESVAFSPDGNRLVTAAGQAARIWDIARREEVGVLAAPSRVYAAAYSPDGRRIVTASTDYMYVWPAFPNTQELMTHARQIMPRHLTEQQRNQFFLDQAGASTAASGRPQ